MSPAKHARVIALIPARSASKRVPGKNVRSLGGHPLIAYTIAPALASGVFDSVIVSTDSEEIAGVARHYGATVPFLRPPELAGELSADIEWVSFTLTRLRESGTLAESFSLLRPTSPFRSAATLRRAWKEFQQHPDAHSMRAVERCRQHPAKMWVVEGDRIVPLLKQEDDDTPWHSRPYQALPPVYAQNASLEIARCSVVFDTRTIAGTHVVPFFTQGHEGVDINEPSDFWYAEHLLATGAASPEPIMAAPFTA